jgi:hypothetical protein
MRDHTKLRGFELADEQAVLDYPLTAHFPREELYGLDQVEKLTMKGCQDFSCFGLQPINLKSYQN